MLQPTLITWILVIFGLVLIFLPMLYAQLLMALRPTSRKAKDIIIGKSEDWRDTTHLHMSYGTAWADVIIWLPLLVTGSIGVLLGHSWGYVLWAAAERNFHPPTESFFQFIILSL